MSYPHKELKLFLMDKIITPYTHRIGQAKKEYIKYVLSKKNVKRPRLEEHVESGRNYVA